MKTIGIVAEYNPFHKGHAWQISEARRRTGADYVIAVMSQDFVQRGEPALVSTAVRTQMALAGGADLVIALPTLISVSSAGAFARGAAGILHALGCVDILCFGVETGNEALLKTVCTCLAEEPSSFSSVLRHRLAAGDTYPEAREKALTAYLHDSFFTEDQIHELCSQPNNILAIEYMTALIKMQSPIQPLPVLRQGAGYLDTSLTDGTLPSSATAIRSYITSPGCCDTNTADRYSLASSLSAFIDDAPAAILAEALSGKETPDRVYRRCSDLLQYTLLLQRDHLEDYLDMTPDLANRIRSTAFSDILDAAALTDAIKTRQLTASRVRRSLLHVFLSIPQSCASYVSKPEAYYAHILGFKKSAVPLLHEMKQRSSIPVISKSAAAKDLLTEPALTLFNQDLRAAELYAFLEGKNSFAGTALRQSPIVYGL